MSLPDAVAAECATRATIYGHIRDRMLRYVAYVVVTHHTVGVLVLVQDSDGDGDHILLVQQSVRQRGCWGMPGGFARRKERPEVTARRELFEEASVDSTQLVLLDAYRQPWARHYELIYSTEIPRAVVTPSSPGRLDDAGRPQWFPTTALPGSLTRETRHALDELVKQGRIPCNG